MDSLLDLFVFSENNPISSPFYCNRLGSKSYKGCLELFFKIILIRWTFGATTIPEIVLRQRSRNRTSVSIGSLLSETSMENSNSTLELEEEIQGSNQDGDGNELEASKTSRETQTHLSVGLAISEDSFITDESEVISIPSLSRTCSERSSAHELLTEDDEKRKASAIKQLKGSLNYQNRENSVCIELNSLERIPEWDEIVQFVHHILCPNEHSRNDLEDIQLHPVEKKLFLKFKSQNVSNIIAHKLSEDEVEWPEFHTRVQGWLLDRQSMINFKLLGASPESSEEDIKSVLAKYGKVVNLEKGQVSPRLPNVTNGIWNVKMLLPVDTKVPQYFVFNDEGEIWKVETDNHHAINLKDEISFQTAGLKNIANEEACDSGSLPSCSNQNNFISSTYIYVRQSVTSCPDSSGDTESDDSDEDEFDESFQGVGIGVKFDRRQPIYKPVRKRQWITYL